MQHHFNINIAQKFGVDIAVFLDNIAFWTIKNIANNKHFYDGSYWTYNSYEAFTIIFPYWTYKQIRTIIANASAQGLILSGNYNATGYDKTKWYALTEKALVLLGVNGQKQIKEALQPMPSLICPNGQMDVPKWADGCAQMGRPIPDSKPDTKPDTTTTTDCTNTAHATVEPVVVVNSAIAYETPKPINKNTENQYSSSSPPSIAVQKLTSFYNLNPVVTKNILCLNDFLSAANHSLKAADKEGFTAAQRLRAIEKFVATGEFDEPKGWVNLRLAEIAYDDKPKVIDKYADETDEERRARMKGQTKKTKVLLDALKNGGSVQNLFT